MNSAALLHQEQLQEGPSPGPNPKILKPRTDPHKNTVAIKSWADIMYSGDEAFVYPTTNTQSQT